MSGNHGAEEKKIASLINSACEEIGCFYVKGHGASEKLIKDTFDISRKFFLLPLEEKMKYVVDNDLVGRGYYPFETQNVYAYMGKKGLPNDPLEKFGLGRLHIPNDPYYNDPEIKKLITSNIWPDNPKEFREIMSEYITQVDKLKVIIFEMFSLALNKDPNFLISHCDKADISVKLNYYPIVSPKENQTRLPIHTDVVPLVILATDDSKESLMVQLRNGEWVYANPVQGAFFINIGDLMARWTNHRWVSTPHQVVWPKSNNWTNRMSIAFFTLPNYDATITCIPKEGDLPKYKSETFMEIMSTKMKALATKE